MAKAMVEVNIPDGFELAEPATRQPKQGEFYLLIDGVAHQAASTNGVSAPILRPAWTWPAWLKAPWIAMGEGGAWYAFEEEPHVSEVHDCWIGGKGMRIPFSSHASVFTFLDFTPPPCTDWRQSKRKNPNL